MPTAPFRNAGALFQSGASARAAGVARGRNPHPPGSPEDVAWITGWRCADEELAEHSSGLGAMCEPPAFDLSDFVTSQVGPRRVDVVFAPAARRYTYFRQADQQLALADPTITGDCGEYEPAVIDCLARAVAYRLAGSPASPPRASSDRTESSVG